MFVDNRTDLAVRLTRSRIAARVSVASVGVCARFGVASDGTLSRVMPFGLSDDDPPDPSRRSLWVGTSITASGKVRGPVRPPFVRGVSLAVGTARYRLAVFGDRRWDRSLVRGTVPTDPAPFDAIGLSFARAFGGSYALSAGVAPGTGLPHPGGLVRHASNPDGVGLYPSPAAAHHQLLPNIEWADQLVRDPRDAPIPAGLSPCPHLPGLRLPATRAALEGVTADPFRAALRLVHHAPGWLVRDDIATATAIRLDGVGTRTLAFLVPPSPVRVVARGLRSDNEVPFRVRSVHIDAEHAVALIAYGHVFRYDPRWPPHVLRVVDCEALSQFGRTGT